MNGSCTTAMESLPTIEAWFFSVLIFVFITRTKKSKLKLKVFTFLLKKNETLLVLAMVLLTIFNAYQRRNDPFKIVPAIPVSTITSTTPIKKYRRLIFSSFRTMRLD